MCPFFFDVGMGFTACAFNTRFGQNHIYLRYTVFLAGKSPITWPFTV